MADATANHYLVLVEKIKLWSKQLGFAAVGITDVDLSAQEAPFLHWLEQNYHGDMQYMANHGLMRTRPTELLPECLRCISVRMDYLPTDAKFARSLKQKDIGYISRYALGRDYHKLMRNRLKQLEQQIRAFCQQTAQLDASFNARPFVDSAPILERPLAAKAGLGWVGKHSLLIDPQAGSWFFLGELLIALPLPILPLQQQIKNQCGTCVACIKICPTQAIVAPYVVDARRCISYLTIELRGAIPESLRPLIGNRIYGCDDCQLICPWNKFGKLSAEADFQTRNGLDHSELLTLFAWDEATFLAKLQGSPIRRIGFDCWQRNIAVALGNADYRIEIVEALAQQRATASTMVLEHIDWALAQQVDKQKTTTNQRLTARLIRSIEKGLPRDA
jgi:epoxyqueuosine reductase